MDKTVISKGKNVKEALSLALELLDARKDEVDIDIINTESKGIMGIGAKPAVIKVSVKRSQKVRTAGYDVMNLDSLEQAVAAMDETLPVIPTHSVPSPKVLSHEATNGSGVIWVEQGRLQFETAPDQFPVLSPAAEVRVIVNGVPINHQTVLCPGDQVDVELEDESQDPEWHVKVSEDEMEATLHVTKVGYRKSRTLKDKTASTHMQLDVETVCDPVPIEEHAVLEQLTDSGIVHGIKLEELARACHSQETGVFTIAEGTPCEKGQDGYFVPVRELEIKKGLKVREDGTVDYKETQEFPMVQAGQLIGYIHPPVPGSPGTTITGNPYIPPQSKEVNLHLKRGAIVVGTNKIVATESGHPDVSIKRINVTVSVVPKLTYNHDINLASGNLHYSGDIEVGGSVQDGMKTTAEGNILIRGNVNWAKVKAGQSVIVLKNIISSEVTAGKLHLYLVDLINRLDFLIDQLQYMIRAIHQLHVSSAFKDKTFSKTGLGPLLRILCDGKQKHFLPRINDLLRMIGNATELGKSWGELTTRLNQAFTNLPVSTLRHLHDMEQLLDFVIQLREQESEELDDPKCFIKASFIQNSRLLSGGDIIVFGKGCYNSEIHARGMVHINGCVRGGTIYGGREVIVKEVGTHGSIPTRVIVSEEGVIRIDRVFEETFIQVGKHSHKFQKDTTFIRARIEENGKLALH